MADYTNMGDYGPFQQELLEILGIDSVMGLSSSSGIDFYTQYGLPSSGIPSSSSISNLPSDWMESDYIYSRDPNWDPSLSSRTYNSDYHDVGGGNREWMSNNQWRAFDIGSWMDDFGSYLPKFNQGDIEDITKRSRVSYDKSINKVLNTADMAGMMLESGMYNNNTTWNNLREVLSSTSRLERFKTAQEKNSLYQEYADDFFAQMDIIAELGGFDIGPSFATDEGEDGIEAETYTQEIDEDFCSEQCGNNADCYETCIGWDLPDV